MLAAVAVAAFLSAAVTLAWVDLLSTGLRPLRDAVSDYGASRAYRPFYWATVVALGIGGALLTVALGTGTGVAGGGLIWLGVFAAARLAIPFFPTDLERGPVTARGRVHVALAAAAFAAIAFAAGDLSPSLADEPGWGSGATDVIGALRWIVVAAAVATLVAYVVQPLRRAAFGGIERVLYAASIAWLVAVAVELAVVAG